MKWFTDLDEDVRVKLIEDHKQQHEIDRKGEISDESAYARLEDTVWSEDGLTQFGEAEANYLKIVDEANIIIGRIKNDVCPDIHQAFEIRKLLIEIDDLKRRLAIWKPKS